MNEFDNENLQNEEPLNQENAPRDTADFEQIPTVETQRPTEGVFNPITYTPVTPVTDYKPASKGLKVFALIMAMVILVTGATLAGYYIGQNNSVTAQPTLTKPNANVNLSAAPADSDELTAAQVYEKLNPSVVGIIVYNADGDGSQASGIVFSEDGYIITNDHIYSEVPNPKFKIYTHDGTEYDAKYVAGDLISDLAVLKIEKCKLTPAVFGNSDELFVGQNVVAIGRPSDATDFTSLTKGVISALNRRLSNTSNYAARLIQTDSPINPGSSGGALVNMYGQIVGVTSAKLASVDYEGVGYAIPTTVMKRIVEELISEGRVVSRAKIGITYTTIDSVIAEIGDYKHTGLLVEDVSEDSDLYGKISKNDVITKINDIEVSRDSVVLDIIEQCRAGDTITITVITSKGEKKVLKAKLIANIGQSSYTTEKNPSYGSSDGTFEFPIGE